MTVFWITAGALLVASAIAMMIALRRGVPDADTAGAADLRVYRDQLAEIERDAARGTIPTEEAARAAVKAEYDAARAALFAGETVPTRLKQAAE